MHATRALVVGLGRSGQAACDLLAALGIPTNAYDARADAPVPGGVIPFLGANEIPRAALDGVDLVVLSPGVPPQPVRSRAAEFVPGTQVEGELSLALTVLNDTAPPRATALVTGTNGKSTITALLGELMAADGSAVFCGGNLGTPLSQTAAAVVRGDAAPEVLVIECSSFQLETLRADIPVDVAILSNLTEDHMDRYADHEAYAATKGRIFGGLRDSGLALLGPQPGLIERVPQGRFTTRVVGGAHPPHVRDGALVLESGASVDRGTLCLAGRHNATNALLALAAARHLGVTLETARTALAAFRGLPHRMTLIAEYGGIRFYDDSKATTIASVVAGLDGFERPFVLLAGGRLKGDDREPLRRVLQQDHARALIGFGEGASAIVALSGDRLTARAVPSLGDAVAAAFELAKSGDAVVLSPGGSSYDQYRNFVDRGEHFASLVHDLGRLGPP